MGKALWLTRLFGRRHVLGKAGAALRTMGPLLRDVVSGRYRPVPWKALAASTMMAALTSSAPSRV